MCFSPNSYSASQWQTDILFSSVVTGVCNKYSMHSDNPPVVSLYVVDSAARYDVRSGDTVDDSLSCKGARNDNNDDVQMGMWLHTKPSWKPSQRGD